MIVTQRYGRSDLPSTVGTASRNFTLLACLYGLLIAYSSLLIGPDGIHYVPLGMAEAWRKFTAVAYIENGSDQRADWIANLLMTIPLTFLVSGALATRRGGAGRPVSALIALAVGLGFILAVKFGQLFFPPRTVTLNYILAQSIGAVCGIALFGLIGQRGYPALSAMHRKGEGLSVVLGAYLVGIIAYFLMPFDLALSPDDLATRLSHMPLLLAPGAGHGPAYRVFLLLADAAATVPVGMFLAVTGRDQSFRSLLLRGIGVIVPVTILSLFVLSATPFAFSLVTRFAGVAAGIGFMWKLKGKDLWKRHYRYARYVPIALPAYILALIVAKGLAATDWIDVDGAVAAVEPRQLLPLWSLYIVGKADAARNFIATFCLFAPIGAMIWLRRGFWSKGAGLSAFLAFCLSLAIEGGRAMRPGLVPDASAPFVAALGAAAAFRAMPVLWKMFEHEAKTSVLRETRVAELERVAVQVFTLVDLQPRLQRNFRYKAGVN